jgi:hypothetical protein
MNGMEIDMIDRLLVDSPRGERTARKNVKNYKGAGLNGGG